MKNWQHFDFSNFFKLETCKNLYKIFLVKLIAMICLIFLLELHNKKATFAIFYIQIVKRVLNSVSHCTVVKKGNIIQILDYELGVFSETLELKNNWTKRIFGLSLHKKKF